MMMTMMMMMMMAPLSFFQVARLKVLSEDPDIYAKLARSLAPSIWELDDIKKGLLCQVSIPVIQLE